jgi:hypothetical protein
MYIKSISFNFKTNICLSVSQLDNTKWPILYFLQDWHLCAKRNDFFVNENLEIYQI